MLLVYVITAVIRCDAVFCNTEVEDECHKKFDAWAEQERCGSCMVSFFASKISQSTFMFMATE